MCCSVGSSTEAGCSALALLLLEAMTPPAEQKFPGLSARALIGVSPAGSCHHWTSRPLPVASPARWGLGPWGLRPVDRTIHSPLFISLTKMAPSNRMATSQTTGTLSGMNDACDGAPAV